MEHPSSGNRPSQAWREEQMAGIRTFRHFVRDLTGLADRRLDEAAMLEAAKPLMSDLLATDDWLPDAFAQPDERYYQQYLLHCDPLERFSLVSFVWGPGQETPIHDHTVWGLLGVLRGSEVSQRYEQGDGAMHASGPLEILESGAIDMVSPTIGDIHKVRNGSKSKASVSIHLYGGNIGAIDRHAYATDGNVKNFRSGYSLDVTPNFWANK
jgi:3-mercaptopropionate dioxygenase